MLGLSRANKLILIGDEFIDQKLIAYVTNAGIGLKTLGPKEKSNRNSRQFSKNYTFMALKNTII